MCKKKVAQLTAFFFGKIYFKNAISANGCGISEVPGAKERSDLDDRHFAYAELCDVLRVCPKGRRAAQRRTRPCPQPLCKMTEASSALRRMLATFCITYPRYPKFSKAKRQGILDIAC
jgi:hypothetical protein